MNKKYIIFLNILFIIFTGFIWLLKEHLQTTYLFLANTLLFALSFYVSFQHKKAMEAKTNFQFLSKNFLITFLRMGLVVSLVLVYYFFMKKVIDLSSILMTMLFYFSYNYLELYFLMKGIKKYNPTTQKEETNI